MRLTSIPEVQNRDFRIDLLRVAGSFAVVVLHVSARVVITSPDVHSSAWWIGNLFDSLSRWSVPLFVMVSGALLLSRNVEEDIFSFYRRRATKLLPPLVFWTAFYLLIQHIGGHTLTPTAVVKSIIMGSPFSHLWYLYMISGLYLITPFLRHIVTASSTRELLIFITGTFTIAAIESSYSSFWGCLSTTFLSSFLPYVAYFVTGYYLYNLSDRTSRINDLLIAVFAGFLLASGTGGLFILMGPKSWDVMYSYLNPIVIVMSLCVFRFGLNSQFLSSTTTKLLGPIAPITLGIYVIHPFFLIALGRFGLTPFLHHPIIGIPLISLTVFILSATSSRLLAAIPFLRAMVKG
ncbi:Surface polysaccharide O-acyltransferase, integral membrane enzyme [Syntrophus gentianae]|uniref:Surface polysaccharide O-acyltransferase, integral membrane enzyme n=1 Tax=Syntrophus gentianae TaxID=43775 RepID=A0A1H7XDW2_9BACT|nr:acyltransferase family protein [Syntrophus gentianae]SEM32072.1 Surface polysaccharide O-acyltransferase, integral membrane enzyme [Syntrophus gentianae]